MPDKPAAIYKAADIAEAPFDFRHPLDEDAEVKLFPLSYGRLSQTGVTLAHLAPGKCSYPQHGHWAEDEWIYILEGAATLRLGSDDHPIEKGDFAAFPAGGPAHKLTNTSDAPLIYLMGGEKRATDIVDFPEQGVRMLRQGDRVETGPQDGFGPFDFFARAGDD